MKKLFFIMATGTLGNELRTRERARNRRNRHSCGLGPKFKIMQTLVDRLNLVSREILTGIMPVRAFSREAFEEARFDKANKDH